MKGFHLIWGFMLLHLLSRAHPGMGLIGYDCTGATLNITTVSLIETGGCDIPLQEVDEKPLHIQLLQINQYASIHVKQCKVEIHRVIRRCGMWSHGMDVPNGEYSYIDTVSRDACDDLYRYGSIKIGQTVIAGITRNDTTSRPISIAGILNQDSECQGVHYSDPYGTWDKVYVYGEAKITLHDEVANVNVETNKVHLASGTRCELNEGHCRDMNGGDTYWDPFPEDSCNSKRYGVLYEGNAIRTTDRKNEFRQTIYSLTEGNVVFALTARDHTTVCGYSLIRTEHPKLLVVETRKDDPFVKRDPLSIANLDLFAYVNSKFVYVEKYFQKQIQQMYNDILIQRCNLERQVLENTIGLAKHTPDEFAYNIMKGPGYMAAIAGEVAHIVKCIAMDVSVRETKECYTQLPVTAANNSYFLSPRTHILKKTGTQVTCNNLVPSMYKINGKWYSLEPRPVSSEVPTMLKPLTKQTWSYRNPQSLATSGIYTQKDLDDLRDHIMFPAESPAILNSVARGIAGQPTTTQGGTIANLIDEQAINKIIESSWEKSWGYFSTFGTVSAGLIGMVMVIRGIKLIIDTLIHGYALHTVYGWSLYLIGAVWDSVTHLLLHLSRKPPKGDGDDDGDEKNPGKPLLPENGTETHSPCAPDNSYARAPAEPLMFGFDPRIYDLKRSLNQLDAQAGTSQPIRVYQGETLPHKFNPGYPTEYQTMPRSYVWKKERSVKEDKHHYKVPRISNETYSVPTDYMVMTKLGPVNYPEEGTDSSPPPEGERLQPSEGIEGERDDTYATLNEIKNETSPAAEIRRAEKPRVLYPTLERLAKATANLPPSESKQMFLSLEKQTHH